jgi:hypothetical protein
MSWRVLPAILLAPVGIPIVVALCATLFRGMPMTSVGATLLERFIQGLVWGTWLVPLAHFVILVAALPIHFSYWRSGRADLYRYVRLGALLGAAIPLLYSLAALPAADRQPTVTTAVAGLVFVTLTGILAGIATATIFWLIAVRPLRGGHHIT